MSAPHRLSLLLAAAFLLPALAAAQANVVSRTLLKRCGDPADIARTVLFLIADAPFVTGQVLAVDGGRSVVL